MPIMSVLILVLNLYARSATESQVIIDLILWFISPSKQGTISEPVDTCHTGS